MAQASVPTTAAPRAKEEALPVGWNVLGAGFWRGGIWTGSWLNYRLWPDSGSRQGYSWPGRISATKTTGWESGRCIWKIVCRLFWLEKKVHSYNNMAPSQREENNEDASAIVVIWEFQEPLLNEDKQSWPSSQSGILSHQWLGHGVLHYLSHDIIFTSSFVQLNFSSIEVIVLSVWAQ